MYLYYMNQVQFLDIFKIALRESRLVEALNIRTCTQFVHSFKIFRDIVTKYSFQKYFDFANLFNLNYCVYIHAIHVIL